MGRHHDPNTPVGALGWHTINVPPGALRAKASNGATPSSYADMPAVSFSGTAHNRVRFGVWMPKSWNEGTVKFKVSGIIDTGGGAGATAVFKMAAKAFSHDDAAWTTADLSTGAQAVNVEWTADDDVLMSAESAELTIDGTPAEGDFVVFELWRDPADGSDDTTAAFLLTSLSVLYQLNSPQDA